MGVKCSEIFRYMEQIAPPWLAEDWDNIGLMVGNRENEVNKVLVCLDVTLKVAVEAIEKKAGLIISHHPVIFKGIKNIDESKPLGKLLCSLIRNNITVYAAHTNLDIADDGVNECLGRTLGLNDMEVLDETGFEKLYKLAVFVPEDKAEDVREAVCAEGAGFIGNYSDCTFMSKGTGTFKPQQGANPYIGTENILEKVNEVKIETIVPESRLQRVISAMLKAHPYEEVAYDVYLLNAKGKRYGLGKVGLIEKPMEFKEFASMVKNALNIKNIRYTGTPPQAVKKVAVFCGSFDDSLIPIIKNKADVLVTGDLKHHTALDLVAAGICAIDAGHFATERIIVSEIARKLTEQFKNLEVIISENDEEPLYVL